MSITKNKRQRIDTAVGCIKEIKRFKQNIVKYKVDFMANGRVHSLWSNWTVDRGLFKNASIMVKYQYIPFTRHTLVRLLELDNLPQYFEYKDVCYTTLITGITMGVGGFLIGHLVKQK